MALYKKIKQGYNNNTNNIIRKYIRHNKQIASLKPSTTFLIKCKHMGIIPNFITNSTKNINNIFKINNKIPPNLKYDLHKTITKFQQQILNLLIQQKHKLITKNNKLLSTTKERVEKVLSEVDKQLFFESENIIFKNVMNRNKRKLIKKFESLKKQQDKKLNMQFNEDWFVNNTDIDIPTNIQWILSLGPKYALPNTKKSFPLFKCIAEGEDIVRTQENKAHQEISRSKLVALIDNHLSKTKLSLRDKMILNTVGQTEKYLKDNSDLLILNSDKGNKTVALNKKDYDSKMNKILRDMCTYKRLKRDPTSTLQNKNNLLIEKLFNMNLIDQSERNKMITKTAIAPRLYGLPKTHKEGIPLRPICSSINSPSYNLCKYIIQILKHLTINSKYNVRDSNEFKELINNTHINQDEIMISFDVVSLFPSIPINLAMKVIGEKWDKLQEHTRIPKNLFMEIVSFCIKDSRYFRYDDKIFEQTKGMPMGSPASPVIADIVMEELLDTTIKQFKTKPKILTKYVDDIFGIIKRDDIEHSLNVLNGFQRQIQFTMELEKDGKLPYLDTIVHRSDNVIKVDWYQKPMASGRLINFYSKHPRRIIMNTAMNFIHRVLTISDKSFHKHNIKRINNILEMNDFPKRTIKNLIKHELTKNTTKPQEKQHKMYKSITYVPGFSERLKHSDIYDKDHYELALRTNDTTNKLFSNTKSKIAKDDKSNLIYKITCKGDESNLCQKAYVGTTKSKLKTRMASHKSDLKAINKPLEQKTALAAHCTLSGHEPDFENIQILAQENNYNRRYTLEMLHIINLQEEKTLNYKRDTENIAQIFKNTINKYKPKYNQTTLTNVKAPSIQRQ